jgi:hypothetical protein
MSPNQPEDPMNASSLQRCYVRYVPLVLRCLPSCVGQAAPVVERAASKPLEAAQLIIVSSDAKF